jgi:demethylmenaquinone methyltransferase/2-methoxy-6-polyprenyl-1,4-benzoquinol methylase
VSEPIAPHPTLHRYYPTDNQRPAAINELFDAGAPFYERICRLMSLGSGEKYRHDALKRVGAQQGTEILDVATGTGIVLRSAVALSGGHAVGLDPSMEMLRQCRKTCAAPLFRAIGERLPFADAKFDIISMGYALRHVADLRALFIEYARVLKPGGRILIMEITQPRSRAGRWFTRLYLRTIVPALAQFSTGAAAARTMMDYFWDTIESCVPPDVILSAMREAGFSNAARKVTGGILSEYTGTKAAH